jgi:GH15 family glucan-1,4-alpha-glucosidase
MDLYRHSIEVILQNQHPGGAYVASPHYSNYQYCWLRDGSFIAYAMDRVGEHQSAEAFLRWVDRTIKQYAYKVDEFERQMKSDPASTEKSILHTRYTLEGEEESTDSTWGNFQIDGYGTWLWALAEHVKLTGNEELLSEFSNSVNVTVRYLKAAWQLPNYDCWEEHPEYLHPYSLAAVYSGLMAVEGLHAAGKLETCPIPAGSLAAEIKDFITCTAIHQGKFVKHVWPATPDHPAHAVTQSGVDSSLLGLAVPYQVFDLGDPVMQATAMAIEEELHRPTGGVYRYKGDVYYGGGEWLLLTAWLGWYDALTGAKDRAGELLAWIERCADTKGNFPEQVSEHPLAPREFQPWVERWGPVAKPLLWSHAMYLILHEVVNQAV